MTCKGPLQLNLSYPILSYPTLFYLLGQAASISSARPSKGQFALLFAYGFAGLGNPLL